MHFLKVFLNAKRLLVHGKIDRFTDHFLRSEPAVDQLFGEEGVLYLVPLDKTIQVNDALLLDLHLILQLINNPLLNLGLLSDFVKLDKDELELIHEVGLYLLEALLDVNVHLASQLKLDVFHVALVAVF